MEELNLDRLESGEMPGLSERTGGYLLEAGLVCLDKNGHTSGVKIEVSGDRSTWYRIVWTDSIEDQGKRAFGDLQEATEYGACGVACLLVCSMTRLIITSRSRKGTGFDYWLGDKDKFASGSHKMFQGEARLEVSGILSAETMSVIDRRVKDKTRQVTGRDRSDLPAYVVVVEFGGPFAKVVRLGGPDEGQRTA